MKITIILSILVLSLLFIPKKSISQEYIAEYQNISEISENIELRKYQKSTFISYYSKEENNQNSYFRVLAGYIFGGNETKEKISMTSPVQIKLNGNQEMLFRVPEKYNTGNLPTPNNKEIKMEIEEARTVAAIRFSGYAREKNVSKHKKILIDKLKEKNINHDENFELWVYDDPFKIKNRRNEIIVNINSDFNTSNE